MSENLSRRGFFRHAAAAPVAAVAGATGRPELPKKAWIVVELGWEYNDEYSFPEGEFPRPKIYFDQAEAEAECRRLCEVFFTAESPRDFEVDFQAYQDVLPEDVTEETVTWDQLREAGFPQPYYVQEMET